MAACCAVLLFDGSVLLVGGTTAAGAPTDRIEVWSPASSSWREWSARLPEPRVGHSLHLLPDATVVVLDGDNGNGFPAPTGFVLD